MMISKLFPKTDCSAFDAFGRVMAGTLKKGQSVRVLGESYSPDDEVGGLLRTSTRPTLNRLLFRGILDNKHSTDVESPSPSPPRVCMRDY